MAGSRAIHRVSSAQAATHRARDVLIHIGIVFEILNGAPVLD